MAIGDDFSIATNGNIRHDSGSTNYTVLEVHRWLQDLADDPESTGTDFMDITVITPSERKTDNVIVLNSPFNVDDTAVEFIYDGSIEQLNGDTLYSGLEVVGVVEAGTELQIMQDEALITSHWSTGKNLQPTKTVINSILVKTRELGADIDEKRFVVWARELGDKYAEFSVLAGEGKATAAIFTSVDLNNTTAEGTISGWTNITNTEGFQQYDISGDGTNEDWYSRWDYDTQTANDVYERTKWVQRRGTATNHHARLGDLFRGVTVQFDFDAQTTNFVEDNIVTWGTSFAYDTGSGAGAFALGEYVSFSPSGAVGKLVYMDDLSGSTGTVVVAKEPGSGTIADGDTMSQLDGGTRVCDVNGTPNDETALGGSAVILATEDSGAAGTLWVQLISGSNPVDDLPLYERGVTDLDKGTVNAGVVTRTVVPEFVGVFTGAAFIGAFGIGVDPTDGIASDIFTDLTGTTFSPPNNQTFTMFGLVSGDRVLVTNNAAGIPDFAQLTLNTTLSGAAETSVIVDEAIPGDTPDTGWLRIETDGGRHQLVVVTSWATSTFTITADSFSADNATAANDVMIGYLDLATTGTSEFTTMTYVSDRTMFGRVREGTSGSPIKTFESTAVFGSGGGSMTAIRTADS